MSELDFSELTNDQLVTFYQAIMQEIAERGEAVQMAARSIYLDEDEKVRIAKESADREAAKLRARERERVAREAAKKVRREADELQRRADELRGRTQREEKAAKAREQARKEAREAILRDQQDTARRYEWLKRAAELVQLKPEEITLLVFDSRYGRRVIINEGGCNRYETNHLLDINVDEKKVKAKRELISVKPLALEFGIELALQYKQVAYCGANKDNSYLWGN